MDRTINARIVKIIGTLYPRLRTMIRNHPYVKVVGISLANCLQECVGTDKREIDDAMLETLLKEGIAIYHAHEKEIQSISVLERKRNKLCELFRPVLEERLLKVA